MDEVSSTYDTLAGRWDEWAAGVVPDVRAEWARKIDERVAEGERVVELGCGTGEPVGRLLVARYDYDGVDVSAGMLAKARAALPDATRLTCVDMGEVAFPSGSLGAVLAFYSIPHTPRAGHGALFARIATWLRPGGVFAGCITSRDDPDGRDDCWLGAGPMRWSGFDTVTNHELLETAGFELLESEVIEQIEPEGTEIRPLYVVARLRI